MDDVEFIARVVVNALFVIPLTILALLPTWFVLQGQWNDYLFWIPITITISGYLYKLMILLAPIMAITKLKFKYAVATIHFTLLGFWGMPILKRSLISLVSTPLVGIEFQRILLTILVIEILGLSAALKLVDYGLKEES